jgi:hypothetical protein
LNIQSALALGSILLHGPLSKAFLAAFTATSISYGDPLWIVAVTDSSTGLMTSKVLPESDLTNFPPMKSSFTILGVVIDELKYLIISLVQISYIKYNFELYFNFNIWIILINI